MLIVDTDTFKERNLQKAGYQSNPPEDGSLDDYHVHEVGADVDDGCGAEGDEGITSREAERSKNFFALGLMKLAVSAGPTEGTLGWVERKFAKRPDIAQGEATRLQGRLRLRRDLPRTSRSATRSRPPRWRRASTARSAATPALAYGLIAALEALPGSTLFLGAYPITPASSILEELARHKSFGVRTFQAEDEIAAVGAALGAAFGGSAWRHHLRRPLESCSSRRRSGSGIMLELPLLILDIQRAGPFDRDADEARSRPTC